MGIRDDYHYEFLSLIEVMAAMKSKTWDKTKAPQLFEKLIKAAGKLECILPVYWSTQVRHMLICRFIPQLNKWGSFWVIAMLVVECYHLHIKRCGDSRKNIMRSVATNYEVFDILQTEWKASVSEDTTYAPSTYPSRYDMQPEEPINIEESLGKRQAQVAVYASEADYRSILLAYKVTGGPVVKTLIAKWALATSKRFCFLHEWQPPTSVHLTAAEENMKDAISRFSKTSHHTAMVRTFFVRFSYLFRSFSCVLFSYFFRTSFVLFSFFFVCTCFVLVSYLFRTCFVLVSYFFRTFPCSLLSFSSFLSSCIYIYINMHTTTQKITRAYLG